MFVVGTDGNRHAQGHWCVRVDFLVLEDRVDEAHGWLADSADGQERLDVEGRDDLLLKLGW